MKALTACVTRTNKRRHHIYRLQMRRFAETLRQDIYVFPAAHTRTKKKHRGLQVDDLLRIQDGDGNAKGPGLFLYTKGPSQSSTTQRQDSSGPDAS
jgi:hypothetical protein